MDIQRKPLEELKAFPFNIGSKQFTELNDILDYLGSVICVDCLTEDNMGNPWFREMLMLWCKFVKWKYGEKVSVSSDMAEAIHKCTDFRIIVYDMGFVYEYEQLDFNAMNSYEKNNFKYYLVEETYDKFTNSSL